MMSIHRRLQVIWLLAAAASLCEAAPGPAAGGDLFPKKPASAVRDWGGPSEVFALNAAAGMDDLAAVREMIARGVDVNSRMDDTRQTPLMAAASGEMVSLLLNAGADPRLVDVQGATALHYAVLKEKALDIIPLLAAAGTDVNAVEPGGSETAFLWAKQWFFGVDPGMGRKVLYRLLQAGADINAKDKLGYTLLHTAAANAKMALAVFLLEQGADASIADTDGRTPLDIARDLKFQEIETLLTDAVNSRTR